jgi:hypothetical protein
MSPPFTLDFLQQKIGAEYVERNPATGEPRLIQGLNEVWEHIEAQGGVSALAARLGLAETIVWGWIDRHCVPERYCEVLVDRAWVSDMLIPSTGYEDPETGECWPVTWRFVGYPGIIDGAAKFTGQKGEC